MSLGDLTDVGALLVDLEHRRALGTAKVIFGNSATAPLTAGTHATTLAVSDGLGNTGTAIVSSIIN